MSEFVCNKSYSERLGESKSIVVDLNAFKGGGRRRGGRKRTYFIEIPRVRPHKMSPRVLLVRSAYHERNAVYVSVRIRVEVRARKAEPVACRGYRVIQKTAFGVISAFSRFRGYFFVILARSRIFIYVICGIFHRRNGIYAEFSVTQIPIVVRHRPLTVKTVHYALG